MTIYTFVHYIQMYVTFFLLNGVLHHAWYVFYNLCEKHHLDIQVFQASEVFHQGKDCVQVIIHADRQRLDRMNRCGCADCRQTHHVE